MRAQQASLRTRDRRTCSRLFFEKGFKCPDIPRYHELRPTAARHTAHEQHPPKTRTMICSHSPAADSTTPATASLSTMPGHLGVATQPNDG